MTFLGLDFETSARYANIALIALGMLAALIGAFQYRWSQEADAIKDSELSDARNRVGVLEKDREPRVIPEQQLKELANLLATVNPKGTVTVGCISGDVESTQLAQQFAQAFADGGFPRPVKISMMLGMAGTGMLWSVADKTKVPASAKAVMDAFTKMGLPLAIEDHSSLFGMAQGSELLLAVLTKPKAAQ